RDLSVSGWNVAEASRMFMELSTEVEAKTTTRAKRRTEYGVRNENYNAMKTAALAEN
ncbi:hypothetical protein CDAR_587201, partial [Caerostris darwini]